MVSIIIPVYKVEQYLKACVDSVLAQTYQDIQVILVDDGSPDTCGAICDAYAAQDSRVISVHKQNGGVSSARNVGLSYASGEYLTFCDSDDLYAPDWIEHLVTAARAYEADVVIGNHFRFYEDGRPEERMSHKTGMTELSSAADKGMYIFRQLLTPDHGWEIWTRLFRTEIVGRENIRFCETCGNFAEDLGFTLTYMLFAQRVVSVEQAGYRYRIRSGSMMTTSASNPKLESFREVCDFCRPAIFRGMETGVAEQLDFSLHFYLLGNQTASCLWASGMEAEDFRQFAVSRMSDWPAMERQIRLLLKQKNEVSTAVPGSRKAECAAHLRFLLGMPWMLLRLQCKLIRVFRPLLDR